jgi:Tfp pilus assembly protein PilP
MYSNQLSLNVAEPPPPTYRFIGLITSKNGMIAVLKSQSDDGDVFNVVKGQKFGTHWRVVNITSQKIEVEDTNIKILHTINFTGEGN